MKKKYVGNTYTLLLSDFKQIYRIMKLTLVLSFMFISGVFATNVSSQTAQVTIIENDIPVKEAISRIEAQTDYLFVYNYDNVDLSHRISLHESDVPVAQVLSKMFENTDVVYAMEGNNILLMKRTKSQESTQDQRTITGTVIDPQGVPVIGANILIKGSTTGVITDIDGNFSLTVTSDAVLTISYIGFNTQEIAVGNKNNIRVTLSEDAQALSEVVVVGYGTVKKRDLTGAISRISADDVKGSTQGNLLEKMQGRVAGVLISNIGGSEPGGGVSVQIRGVSTFNENTPLYIVDGVPVDNLNVINPNEIESIEVLKDASSSAIYGSRAAHGVVLVSTKKGKSDYQRVSLNAYWGAAQASNLPKMANADQYYDMVLEAHKNGNTPVNAGLDALRAMGANTNWWEEITQGGLTQDYNLGITGGSDKLTYSSNIGYRDESGIIQNTGYKRYSYRLNTEYKYNEAITIGSNLSVSNYSKKGVYSDKGQYLYSAYILDPLTPVYNPNADPLDPDYAINQYMNSTVNVYASNPLAIINRQTFTDETLLLIGNLYADIKIYKGLSFTSNLGINLNNNERRGFTHRYYLSAADNVPRGWVQNQTGKTNSFIWNNLLKYNQKFGSHTIDFVGGQTAEKTMNNYVYASKDGTPFNDLQYRVLSAATANDQTSGSIQEWTLLSYLARLNYNYADKYLLTASIRQDGSSRFAKQNRWGTFPSFSAGWRISEEDFFQKLNLDFISDIKLRAGWGSTGNQRISNNAYLTLIGGGLSRRYVFGNNVIQGYGPSSVGNPDIKWETTTQTNLGLDFLLGGNFSVTADYYIKNTEDLLMEVPLPVLSGYPNNPWSNTGSIRNKGFELLVSYDRYDTPIKHSFSVNLSTVSTVVTSLAGDAPITGSYTRSEVGLPFGQFYGWMMDGVFQNQAEIDAYSLNGKHIQPNAVPGDFKFRDIAGPKDENGNPTGPDGVVDDNDKTFIGNPFPDFTYGFTTSLEYKGFDFNMLLQGQYGNDIWFQRKRDVANMNGSYNVLEDAYKNAWRGEGTSNTYARITSVDTNDNFRNSSWYIEDGSYLRVKNVQLGYSLPKKVISKLWLSKCRLYVSATNLLTLTDYSGRDPEIGNTNPMSVGVDMFIYPQTKTYVAGIEVEF